VNEGNKKANIREEVDRANEAIRAANLLFENGFVRDAISKIYYSLLYNIRALLLTEGLEPTNPINSINSSNSSNPTTQ